MKYLKIKKKNNDKFITVECHKIDNFFRQIIQVPENKIMDYPAALNVQRNFNY